MKKNSGYLIPTFIVTLVIVLSSCASKKSSPEEVTLSFFNLLYNDHDLEKAELLVTEASREKLRNDFKFIEGALQFVEEKEPTRYEYKVEKEKTEIENDSAFVFISSSLDTSHMKILLLSIKEEWKIDFNYDEHTLNVANKDLIDDVLETMEGFVDSVSVGEK
ncbi:MAG: hypothetical protein ACHQFW_07215 [Chitinophagales bacterium]